MRANPGLRPLVWLLLAGMLGSLACLVASWAAGTSSSPASPAAGEPRVPALSLSTPTGAPSQRLLLLQPRGEARELPTRLLGASVEPWFEHLLDNPQKVDIARQMGLAFVRFPGGSESNYYDWRSGLPNVTTRPESSSYMRFWAKLAGQIQAVFPQGIKMEDYAPFARSIGADTVLVPNLETSSIPEQTAWFKTMSAEGIVPGHIELGNEFWIAMAGDPDVMRKWPDEPTSLAISKQCLDALRPYLPPGTKVAVQSAGSAFAYEPNSPQPFVRRLLNWDAALQPESWFDAVTLHLYPDPRQVLGLDPTAPIPNDSVSSARLFTAMMARSDEGVDRVLSDIETRLPGKEIWITEWNPRGPSTDYSNEPVNPSMLAQLAARMTFAYLRHPAVRVALFFMLNFSGNNSISLYYPDGQGGFAPYPAAIVLQWFNEAANGGPTYQEWVEAGGQRVAGGGLRPESFLEIEAATFTSSQGTVLILQNASADSRSLDPATVVAGRKPTRVESISLPDLGSPSRTAVVANQSNPTGRILIPPYSVVKVDW